MKTMVIFEILLFYKIVLALLLVNGVGCKERREINSPPDSQTISGDARGESDSLMDSKTALHAKSDTFSKTGIDELLGQAKEWNNRFLDRGATDFETAHFDDGRSLLYLKGSKLEKDGYDVFLNGVVLSHITKESATIVLAEILYYHHERDAFMSDVNTLVIFKAPHFSVVSANQGRFHFDHADMRMAPPPYTVFLAGESDRVYWELSNLHPFLPSDHPFTRE